MELTEFPAQIRSLRASMEPFRLIMTPEAEKRLLVYCAELVFWNRRYALLSRSDVANVLRKHVAASLGGLLVVEPRAGTTWVDVGTGAGLPGLILKIWSPEQQIVLVDGSRKKCNFLESVIRSLRLGPMEVLATRVETLLARGQRVGQFDALFCRAVCDLTSTLRDFGPLLRPGGDVVTFKGQAWSEDLECARTAGILNDVHFRLESVHAIPWTRGHILRIRKLA
jgi:16S rRNA (guanine527-N7)-methyltransferase